MKHFTSNKATKKTYVKMKCTNSFRKMLSVILAMVFILSMTFPVMATPEESEPWYLINEAQAHETFETIWEGPVVLEATPVEGMAANDSITIIFNDNGLIDLEVPASFTVETPGTVVIPYVHHERFIRWLHPDSVQVVYSGQEIEVTGSGIIRLYASWDPDQGASTETIAPLWQNNFQITNPSFNGQTVPHQNLSVNWTSVPGATYVLSLRNLRTYFLIHNHISVTGTSRTITQAQLEAGSRFRVAVRARVGSVEQWREREFVVQAPPAATLTLNPPATGWHPGAAATSINFTVTTNQASWSASSSHNWLSLNRTWGTSGQVLTASVSANTSTSSRTAWLTVTAGNQTRQVTVTQAGAVPTATVPAAINNLNASPGNGQVTLSWGAPFNGGSPIIQYQFRQRTGNGAWGVWQNTNSTATFRTITGLTNGTSFSFQVRAANAIGAAFDSNTVTATPVAPATRSISLTSGTMTFAAQTVGYAQPAAQSTVITNNGNVATGQLTVTAPTGFQVSANQTTGFANSITIASIVNTNGTATFWTRPITGLAAGTRTGNVTVANTSTQSPPLTARTRAVSFTVNAAATRNVILNAGTGAHWGTTAPSGWVRHAPVTGNITAIRQSVVVGAAMPTFPIPTTAPTNQSFSAWSPARLSMMPSGTGDWSTTATWAANTVTLTFFPNGATGSVPGNMTVQPGGSDNIPGSGNLRKPGYDFLHWTTRYDGTGARFNAGERVSYETLRTLGTNITLHAQWRRVPVWRAFGNEIGFFPGAITLSNTPQFLGEDVPYEFRQTALNVRLGNAITSWTTALRTPTGGLPIGRAAQENANIRVFGGSATEMWRAANDRNIGLFAGAVARPRGGGTQHTIDGVTRTVHTFTSQDPRRMFITFNDHRGGGDRHWTREELEHIVVHELGHALGFLGESRFRTDVMFGNMSVGGVHGIISPEEARHLRRVYEEFRPELFPAGHGAISEIYEIYEIDEMNEEEAGS